MTHGLASRDRNASGCVFTPQSRPDPFRNLSTAITSRGGRLVLERLVSGTGVKTGARLRSGTVPVPKLWCEHGLSLGDLELTRCKSTLKAICVGLANYSDQ